MLEGGPYFASAGEEIKIWDSSNLQVVKDYSFHKGNVKDLSWSRDNSFLCSTASSGDKILLVDCNLYNKEKPKIVAQHAVGEHQSCIRVSPSSRKLYSGGVDGAVCAWDKESGKIRKMYKNTHVHPITCIALNGSETYLASGSNKGDVVIRNLSNDTTSKPSHCVSGQAIRRMEFSPWKHSLLGITTDDGSLNLWDTLQGAPYHNFTQVHSGPAMDLVFSPFNDLVLASVGLDKHLMIYDVKKHKFLNKVKSDQPLTSLAFLYDGYSIFAGSSLGTIYRYDLRHFSRAVESVAAHNCSIQRITVQSVIKSRKDRVRSSKSDVIDRQPIGGDASLRGHKTSSGHSSDELRSVDGRGDHFSKYRAPSSDHSSSTSSSRERRNKTVTNGYGHTEKAGSSVQNSTPTYKSAHDFVSRVDDMSGLISPLREEVFDITSQDPNLTNYPQDPSLMGTTLSSSVDTMGSYCDDIFSPISRNSKGGKVPSGTQINSKTSPHPLRQSYSAANADKQESFAKLRNSAPAPPTKKFLHPKPQAENYLKEETKTSSLPNSSTPSSIDSTKKINFLPDKSAFPSESAPSHNGAASQAATSSDHSNSPHLPPSTSSRSSAPPSQSLKSRSATPGLQIQADFLRSTVKELVDELGDDLRRQINGVLNSMVKLSLQQEDLIQRLLTERRCDVNEQLLRECERLREENERLKMKNPYL